MIPPAEDLIGNVRMKRLMHADGRDFFVNIDECVEYPRLSRQETVDRRTGEVATLWMVDQHPAGELEDAVAVINGDNEHVPIAEQIDTVEVLIAGRELTADEQMDLGRQLRGIERTLRWCQDNVDELRRYRKMKAAEHG
ncbi:hypothetical protein GCM10007913_12010 [Devosia yakushimensis]|uniref:Uncharacterized protein n=1 Tax=Devosia yakushimensis TaxID=470028 RepID=A0ABQ5UBM1_9HYPH|nr:hypothetical protein [Devosia yakushimensis]GLQ09269.1 hypothetical protein GCM10007913_12010 [Devosia yakushimensis]